MWENSAHCGWCHPLGRGPAAYTSKGKKKLGITSKQEACMCSFSFSLNCGCDGAVCFVSPPPWLPCCDGLQPGTADRNKPLLPQVDLSGYFITETDRKTRAGVRLHLWYLGGKDSTPGTLLHYLTSETIARRNVLIHSLLYMCLHTCGDIYTYIFTHINVYCLIFPLNILLW